MVMTATIITSVLLQRLIWAVMSPVHDWMCCSVCQSGDRETNALSSAWNVRAEIKCFFSRGNYFFASVMINETEQPKLIAVVLIPVWSWSFSRVAVGKLSAVSVCPFCAVSLLLCHVLVQNYKRDSSYCEVCGVFFFFFFCVLRNWTESLWDFLLMYLSGGPVFCFVCL